MVEKILVDSPLRERGYFNASTVKAVVDGHLNHGENHTFLLMALMIFEIGQQEFCDGARCESESGSFEPSESPKVPLTL